MLHNNRSHRPETETPPPSSVQDYLARKYASLGIDPPEPNGHPPGHIPETLTDERSDVGHPAGEQNSDLSRTQPEADSAQKHADSVRFVRFENPESVQPATAPSNPAEQRSDPANGAPEAGSPKPVAGAAPKPLTRDQRTALDLLDRGQSVTEIMDTLGYHRKTFYDWGKANPTFAHAAESARDNRRGVLADGVHDLQLAALSLVGNYIRSDNSPDSIRLRAASLVFRHAHSETLLPRRILATFTAPDGISPASPGPNLADPLDPPQNDPNLQDPGGPGSDATPTEPEQHTDLADNQDEQRSDLANTPCNERSNVANSSPDPGTRTPDHVSPNAAPASASAPICAQENADSVRSVRFENSQSTNSTDDPASSEIRTPNVSDGFPPSPERERRVPAESSVPPAPIATAEGAPTGTSNYNTIASSDERSNVAQPNSDEQSDVAPTPGEQRSDLAPSEDEQRSDLASLACDERGNVANLPPDPGSRTPDPAPAAPSEIRTPNVSDGFPPSPERERRVPAESPKPRKPETLLADAFLAATFLHKHEPRAAFETLLKHQLRAYAPATPQEELLTFRITQKSWILRRLDTFERVIADSAVTKVRDKHPNAAPVACIAMTYLERKDTETTRFYERIAQQRKDHEAALDRLEFKLQTLQARRESRQDQRDNREARREDRRASAAPKRQTPIPATALPFHPAPTLRATG